MVSSDNISPKKLATTAKVYESRLRQPPRPVFKTKRGSAGSHRFHCGYDGEKLALAKALLNRVISEGGEGFIVWTVSSAKR